MKLRFREKCLGEICHVSRDQPWWIGDFRPSPEAAEFSDFFAWMVDEERSSQGDPPFDPAWWADDNWFIEEDDGTVHPICVPAIHDDGQIWLRMR